MARLSGVHWSLLSAAGDPDTNVTINRQRAIEALRHGFSFVSPALLDLMMVQIKALEASRAKSSHMLVLKTSCHWCWSAGSRSSCAGSTASKSCTTNTRLQGTFLSRKEADLPCACALLPVSSVLDVDVDVVVSRPAMTMEEDVVAPVSSPPNRSTRAKV